MLIFVPEKEEILSPRNVSCSVILLLLLIRGLASVAIFQFPCSIDTFVYFAFSILPSTSKFALSA